MHARRLCSLLVGTVLCGVSAVDAGAATNIFLKFETGDRAASEQIPALGFRMPASPSPPEAATGTATGKRQYEPLVIVKSIDKSSPMLRARQPKGPLGKVEILFVGDIDQDGRQDAHTIRLTGASVLAIRPGTEPATEEVVFGYSKIEVDGKDASGENVLKRAFVVPHILERTASVTR